VTVLRTEGTDKYPVVDAHHHLWTYQAAEFDWITDDMAALKRDSTPVDLQISMRDACVDRSIAVQARQKVDATQTSLKAAEAHPFIAGVVGWVPLAQPAKLDDALAELGTQPRLNLVQAYVVISIALLVFGVFHPGAAGAFAVLATSLFMSIIFPTVFAFGIKSLGVHTKLGALLIVMSVIGGAVFPPLLGLIARAAGSLALGYLVHYWPTA